MFSDSPSQTQYLWLLALLPWIPIVSFLVYKKRLWFSTALRVLVCSCVVFAIVDFLWLRPPLDTDVLLLVDQSDSLDADRRSAAWEYAVKLATENPDTPGSHRIGLISFGREPLIEQPLAEKPVLDPKRISSVDGKGSNIGAAIRFCGTLFDREAHRRIVIVTDGESTDRTALTEGKKLSMDGVEIDVALIPRSTHEDVVVEGLDCPPRAHKNSPFRCTVRIRRKNLQGTPTPGRLIVQRVNGINKQVVADLPVTLSNEVDIISLESKVDTGGMSVFEARFVADDTSRDIYSQNNVASGIVEQIDDYRVLFVTTPDQTDSLRLRLQFLNSEEIPFDVQDDTTAFQSIADLLRFDAVVMVNAPRLDLVDDLPIAKYTDEQLLELQTYVHDFGGGLLMTGGPRGLGAGNWTNTPIEDAMPVEFQVKNEQIVATSALALVIDKSGSMNGDKMEACKSAAIASLKLLSDTDSIGIYPFDDGLNFPVPLRKVGENKEQLVRKVRRIAASGGTNMTDALQMAYRDLQKSTASLKHVIVLTDGQTFGSDFANLAGQMKGKGITTSSIAVGGDSDKKFLMAIANRGGGRFYQVDRSSLIPRVFMKETRMLTKPLIQEFDEGISSRLERHHEVTQGMSPTSPPLHGLVLTTRRENALVESLFTTDQPESPNNTLMACWQYGAGRTAVWTSDLGERWAMDWNREGHLDRLLIQTLRWMQRNHPDHNHHIRVQSAGGNARIRLEWGGPNESAPSEISVVVAGIGTPERFALKLSRIGPRDFEGELQGVPSGNFAMAFSGGDSPLMTYGITIPEIGEFESHPESQSQLRTLSSLTTTGPSGFQRERKNDADTLQDPAIRSGSNARWDALVWEQTGLQSRFPIDLWRPTTHSNPSQTSTWPYWVIAASFLLLGELVVRKFGLDQYFYASERSINAFPRMPISRSEKGLVGEAFVAKIASASSTPIAVEPAGYTERLLQAKRAKPPFRGL